MSKSEVATFGATVDVAQLVGTIAIAMAIDGDVALRQALWQSAGCSADQALTLQLPNVPAALEFGAVGALRPIRITPATPVHRLEALVSAPSELQRRVLAACTKAEPAAQGLLEAFFVPGSLPSRSDFDAIFQWGPLIEAPAYRFVARATSTLDGWRHSALSEAARGGSESGSVISFYYPLNHTMAHLTLLCSERSAGPWLVEMARSFEWRTWTPSFPLVRERTVWLTAAAAKSAAAFGPDVVDRYLRVVTDSRHAYKAFDALFGLASIALAHDHVLAPITKAVIAAQDTSLDRITTGAEQSLLMFRAAIAALRRWADERQPDPDALRQLGWDAGARVGLATRQAFRLDPSDIDARGQVLGFSALPAIMQASPGEHYPRRSPVRSPLLPRTHELAGLLTRAWGAGPKVRQTLH
jgi:hypothetical protein